MRKLPFVLNEGDWISGKTANDEKFRGYVERIDSYGGKVKVKVLESDRESIIGSTVEAALAAVEPIAAEGARSEAELLDMIDLALQTRDRTWFEELSSQLSLLRGAGTASRGIRPERLSAPPRSRVM
ncbi:IDEAL domain-containing protein [Gordoniibacillus kamchatkensis]|uniref:IDEAL domain-containing protein n=1 Tax=Gordoniibacillus kamchatkensis TaxID=1590651 RepID=UPI000A7D6B4C|nr:IDEAL domain-containing protein [Paenibacillus sp. VKM B-2647]